MAYPETQQGKKITSSKNEEVKKVSSGNLSMARYVLRNNFTPEAKRTVEDIIEIGRELTAIKAELPHGQFLPWIAAEFEMTPWTANQFMNAADRFGDKNEIITYFKPTILYALSAPSTPESVIEKAIEQAEAGDKVTVADVKQWKEAAQAASQRAEEFRQESNERRKKIRELEQQVDFLKAEKPEPEVRIEAPSDYEATKERAAKWPNASRRGRFGDAGSC